MAVVDPHRPDCAYPDPDLTGAGLSYKLAAALLARHGVAADGLDARDVHGFLAGDENAFAGRMTFDLGRRRMHAQILRGEPRVHAIGEPHLELARSLVEFQIGRRRDLQLAHRM